MRPLKEIIVHCTATRPDWREGRSMADKVAEIRRWHVKDRGWKDIGYHYLIDRDGEVAEGRPLDVVGAHVAGHNTGTIGISLLGGHGGNANDHILDNFTPHQEDALRTLIERLMQQYPTITKVTGHNDYAAKACPTFKAGDWWSGKKERTHVAQSTTVQASAVQLASGLGGGVAAVGALDGNAQIVALVICAVIVAAAAWVMRERIRKWAAGVR